MLHRGLPGEHQDHRQRADPDEGTGGRAQVRPAGLAGLQDRPAPAPRHPGGPGQAHLTPATAPGTATPTTALDREKPQQNSYLAPAPRTRSPYHETVQAGPPPGIARGIACRTSTSSSAKGPA